MSPYQNQQQQQSQGQQPTQQANPADKLSIIIILYNQISAINASGNAGDTVKFDSGVDILQHLMPFEVAEAVRGRSSEFTRTEDSFVYTYWCGHPQGTVEHPYRDSEGHAISPIATKKTYLDYRLLFHIQLQELQKAGYTWKTEAVTTEWGRVDQPKPNIPLQTLEMIRTYMKERIEEDTSTGHTYQFWELAKSLVPEEIPPTPKLDAGMLEEEETELSQ